MAEFQPSEIRVGDIERDSAMRALGEHMSAGRLDVDEYGDRSAKVATAKTQRELRALFDDLPEPHPTFGPSTVAPTAPGGAQVARTASSAVAQRLMAALVPFAGIIAVALFFWLHEWVVFLLPAAIAVLGGAFWGDQWRPDRHRSSRRSRGRRRD